jgi:hypothetical protein
MSFDAHHFVGVDPCGGRKPFTYAVLDKNGKLVTLSEGEIDEVLAFLADLRGGLLIGVNSPPRPSVGLVRQETMRQNLAPLRTSGRSLDMRLAEHQLREHGINVAMTPSRKELCTNWVQAGFAFYRGIAAQGFHPYPVDNAEHQWIETHPHATFCALLEQNPLPRPTLEGRLQRQLVLYEQGLGIHDPIDFFEEITRHKLLKGVLPMEQVYTPEQLDAIAAACVTWMLSRRPERTCRVGDAQEGQILLPVAEMKAKY